MLKNLSILVVDDTKFTRAVLVQALNRTGCMDIREAKEGEEALKLLNERMADVVIADWEMPVMDGLQLTKAIRTQDEVNNRYTSIMLLTGHDSEEQLQTALHTGADDFLTKPFKPLELNARVYAAARISLLQNRLLETSTAMLINTIEMEKINTIDPVTKLGNRKYLDRRLEELLAQINNRGGGMYLCLMEVDDNEEVENHDVWDDILKSVANRLRQSVRPTDVIIRMDGREFAAILYHPKSDVLRPSTVERVQKDLCTRPIQTDIGQIHITLSIGATFYTHNKNNSATTHIGELLKTADQNLNTAQTQGGNQIIVS